MIGGQPPGEGPVKSDQVLASSPQYLLGAQVGHHPAELVPHGQDGVWCLLEHVGGVVHELEDHLEVHAVQVVERRQGSAVAWERELRGLAVPAAAGQACRGGHARVDTHSVLTRAWVLHEDGVHDQ